MSTPRRKQNIWFFVSVHETNSKGIPRARILSGYYPQHCFNSAGTDYNVMDPEYNIQGARELRESLPIGTIFSAREMKLAGKNSNYYAASGEILPQSEWNEKIQEAYRKFLSNKIPFVREERAEVQTSPVHHTESSDIGNLLKTYPVPTPENDGYYVDPLVWSRLVFNFSKKRNSMLTGPSGTCKTEISLLLGKITKNDTFCHDFGAKLDAISSLIGSHRFDSTKGGSYFERAAFTYALEKPGITILDEVNRASAAANNILFPVLDSRRKLVMDTCMGEEKTVSVHPDNFIISTANIGPSFSGTSALDPAFKQRFRLIPIDYMPKEEEVKILQLRSSANKKDCETIVDIASQLRELHLSGQLSEAVSPRHTIDAAEMVGGGFQLPVALELAFLPYFMDEERLAVRDVISSL